MIALLTSQTNFKISKLSPGHHHQLTNFYVPSFWSSIHDQDTSSERKFFQRLNEALNRETTLLRFLP